MELFDNSFFSWILALGMGVIGFFLKRVFSEQDKLIAENKEMARAITEIREGYTSREDFFRELAKLEKKLDRITEILMELQKGGGK